MAAAPPTAAAPASRNGNAQISREIELAVASADLEKVRRLSFSLSFEDQNNQVVHETSQKIDLEHASSLEKLLLQLNIQKQG